MKIELEPTGRFEAVEGVQCRIWRGTYLGHPIVAHIPMIGMHTAAPESAHREWGRELQAIEVERQIVSFDCRML